MSAAAIPRAVRWPLLAAATLATWLPIAALDHLAVPTLPGAVHEADFVAAPGDVIPASTAPWTRVSLPDDWRDRHPRTREGWYRIRLRHEPQQAMREAIYFPSVSMNAAVFLNAELIGSGGRFEDPVARNANRPLLFSFPEGLLRPGDNEFHFRVKADFVDDGFVPALAIGSFADLESIAQRSEFIRGTMVWILMVVRLVVASFTAAIWMLRRRDGYYGWFTLSATAWVLAELNLVVVEPPVSTLAWYWIINVAIGWWGITAVRLVLSFVGVSKPRAERNLTMFGAFGSAILGGLALVGSPHLVPLAVNVWLLFAFLASCYLFRGVIPLLLSYPDERELNVVFVVSASVVGCVLFDLIMQLGLRPRGGISAPTYGSLVAIVGMGWVLVRRFVRALRQSQSLAAALEARVREKHAELEQRYHEIAELDRERTLSEERARVLSDMQDGLGAQLASTLALIDGEEASPADLGRSVRAALDDLRLVIDSLDPAEGEIVPALATLRTRMQPRFDASGLDVRWEVDDVPPIPDLGPHRLLVLLRIVHDLFGAALLVPGGRVLAVRIAAQEAHERVVIEIALETDEAKGGGIAENVAGVDLEMLARRARDVGIALEAEGRDEYDAMIRLSIALPRADGDQQGRAGGSVTRSP